MRYLPQSLVVSVVFGLWAVSGAMAQATINDCEKIQAADAYNQCLAKFGPSGKDLNVEPPRAGDIKGSSADAAATGGKPAIVGRHVGRHRGAAVVRRGGGGRKRATFYVHRRH